jgi:hypothetical protein
MLRPLLRAVTALALLAGSPLSAQNTPSFGCPGAEHRQFDFWVGTWEVTVGANLAGRNIITAEEDGCLIHEHWTGSRGGTGQSFNFYDAVSKQWHQVWVDNQGTYLHLTGGYADNKMRFTGSAVGPGGQAVPQQLTFFRNADGTVRQLWQTSADGGTTWTTVFDGLYRKK